jgi:hypothetical protein
MIMSDEDLEAAVLKTVEYLENEYDCHHKPCIALLISRQYRVLSGLNNNYENRYLNDAFSWLIRYARDKSHSQKIQIQLLDFIQFESFKPL